MRCRGNCSIFDTDSKKNSNLGCGPAFCVFSPKNRFFDSTDSKRIAKKRFWGENFGKSQFLWLQIANLHHEKWKTPARSEMPFCSIIYHYFPEIPFSISSIATLTLRRKYIRTSSAKTQRNKENAHPPTFFPNNVIQMCSTTLQSTNYAFTVVVFRRRLCILKRVYKAQRRPSVTIERT